MRISDWSSDVCSSDLTGKRRARREDGGATPPAPRTNLYDDVTHRIVAELVAGRFPWVQPWGRTGIAATGLPRNAITGRSYPGVINLILWGSVIEPGWHPRSRERVLGNEVGRKWKSRWSP